MDRCSANSFRCSILWRLVVTNCLAVVCLSAIGCGGGPKGNGQPTSKLTGSVTIDGTPVKTGQLQFMPDGGGQALPTSAEIVDGKYTAKDVPRGSVRVMFSIVKETGEMDTSTSQPFPKVVNIVPQKHRGGEQIQVTADETRDFALTSK
jgi:hypothetical protein